MSYEAVKALHLIALICWFAGLFYLPRIFVYLAMDEHKPSETTLNVMAFKLYKYIMNPAMMATWVFGITLLYLNPYWFEGGWLHSKLLCVVLLTIFHIFCGRYVKVFARQQNKRNHKFYRYFNEIPTILLIVIVVLAVLKPF